MSKELSEIGDDDLLGLLEYVSDEVKVRSRAQLQKYGVGRAREQLKDLFSAVFTSGAVQARPSDPPGTEGREPLPDDPKPMP